MTETIPTIPGWIPIKSESRYVPRHRIRADVDNEENQDPVDPTPSLYPQQVNCVKKKPTTSIKSVTTKIQGNRITLKAATKSVITTIVQTSTVTEYPPDLSTTVISTVYPKTTSWTETTSVSTFIQTGKSRKFGSFYQVNLQCLCPVVVESQVPVATEYAACQDSNILITANGGHVITATSPSDLSNMLVYNLGPGYTPTSCCEACHKNPSCRYSRFVVADTKCYAQIFTPRLCPTGEQYMQRPIGRFFTNHNTEIQAIGIFSNGPCGSLWNGGID